MKKTPCILFTIQVQHSTFPAFWNNLYFLAVPENTTPLQCIAPLVQHDSTDNYQVVQEDSKHLNIRVILPPPSQLVLPPCEN